MNIEINCCLNKRLVFDIKETKRISLDTSLEIPVYRCEGCNKLYTLNCIGEKEKRLGSKRTNTRERRNR